METGLTRVNTWASIGASVLTIAVMIPWNELETVQPQNAVLPLAALVLGFSIHALMRPTQNYFKVGETHGGDCTIQRLRSARRSMKVTHFTAEVPKPDYAKLMKQRIEAGLKVVRLLPEGVSRPSWCSEFDKLDNGYTERRVPWELPFDVAIIDSKHVVLMLPALPEHGEYSSAITFHNQAVARTFEVLLDRMAHISPRASGVAPTRVA